MIAGSSDEIGGGNGAGIDLSGSAIDETPSGDTTIAGNWIGVDPFGEAAGNEIGVKVGAAGVAAGVMIGGVTAEDGNLIAGNNGTGDRADRRNRAR